MKIIALAVAKQLQNCITLNPIALINDILEAIHASKCNTYIDFISYLPVLDPLSMCDMSTISSGSVTPLKGVRHSTPGKAGWNKVCGSSVFGVNVNSCHLCMTVQGFMQDENITYRS